MVKAKQQTQKGFGKIQGKSTRSSKPSLFDELTANRLEIEKEVLQERKQRIKGMSSEELMRSPHWVYEMANEEIVKGTLNEMLKFLSENNDPFEFNLATLQQKALSDGGIDLEVSEEIYETIEYEPEEIG
ncbi:MAG: hypothetical protein AB4058_21155 [Microcystaceae cyanobacterium]